MPPTDAEIARTLRDLAERRGPDRTFCPSEAARALDPDWRILMPRVRSIAHQIGLVATQKGRPVDPRSARGPIRLGLGQRPR